MTQNSYDLLVVGSGPGGQAAAITAAKLGKRVGLVERKPYLGGVSLQTGTIPSKALREAAFLASRFNSQGMRDDPNRNPVQRGDFLIEAMKKKKAVINSKESVLLSRLLSHGVTILPGEAAFKDPHTIMVNTLSNQQIEVSAAVIILAAGSRPRRPQQIPFDRERVLDSTSILNMRHIPESLVVIGGGVIACEFATMFAPLGVDVTLIDSHSQLLAYLDEDIAAALVQHMRDMEIKLYMETRVDAIRHSGEHMELTLNNNQNLVVERVLYAMGRQPNYDHLKLGNADLSADDHGWLSLNEHHQTQQDHIYAIGDLAGRPALASTAMEQGRRAALHAFDRTTNGADTPLPMAIYTIPELSYIGATEKELNQQNISYVTGKALFNGTARGLIIGDHGGFIKLLVARSDRKLLGVHIIGEAASELIHIAQILIGLGGTIEHLANNVFNYPTLAKCYKDAAIDCLDQLTHSN